MTRSAGMCDIPFQAHLSLKSSLMILPITRQIIYLDVCQDIDRSTDGLSSTDGPRSTSDPGSADSPGSSDGSRLLVTLGNWSGFIDDDIDNLT